MRRAILGMMAMATMVIAGDNYRCERVVTINDTRGTRIFHDKKNRDTLLFNVEEKVARAAYTNSEGDTVIIEYPFDSKEKNDHNVMVTTFQNKSKNYLMIDGKYPKGEIIVTGVNKDKEYLVYKYANCKK